MSCLLEGFRKIYQNYCKKCVYENWIFYSGLFMRSFEECLDIATKDGFKLMEILCEGPYWPRNVLNHVEGLEIFSSYDLDIFLHAPTIDLNPASLNPGIRDETLRQLVETVDLAVKDRCKGNNNPSWPDPSP